MITRAVFAFRCRWYHVLSSFCIVKPDMVLASSKSNPAWRINSITEVIITSKPITFYRYIAWRKVRPRWSDSSVVLNRRQIVVKVNDRFEETTHTFSSVKKTNSQRICCWTFAFEPFLVWVSQERKYFIKKYTHVKRSQVMILQRFHNARLKSAGKFMP